YFDFSFFLPSTALIVCYFSFLPSVNFSFFFFQAEDGIRDRNVTGVQTCALPISGSLMLKLPGAYVASGSLVYFGIALRVIAIALRVRFGCRHPDYRPHARTLNLVQASLPALPFAVIWQSEARQHRPCWPRWP